MSTANGAETTRFPDLEPTDSSDYLPTRQVDGDGRQITGRTPSPRTYPRPSGATTRNDKWQARRDHHVVWGNGHINPSPPNHGHGRQKSISEAIHTIRTRKGSVSANAAELADALKAPVSVRLIVRLPHAVCIPVAHRKSRFSLWSGT